LVSHMTYHHKKGSLGFWKTPSGNEIDFLWWYGNEFIAIEVKSSKKFKNEFLKGIHSFQEKKPLKSSWIVYLGDEELKINQTRVVPALQFLQLLSAGRVIP